MAYSQRVEDTFLTAQELADRYKLPLHTIYKWRSTGYGPPGVRLGRHVRFRLADVIAWESRRAAS